MPRFCFVVDCNSSSKGESSQEPRHYFSVPKDELRRKQWDEAINRGDRRLMSTSKVCDLHFSPDDIIRFNEFKINGNVVREERKKWHLKPTAIPLLHLGKKIMHT